MTTRRPSRAALKTPRTSSVRWLLLALAVLAGCREDPALVEVHRADRLLAEGDVEEAVVAYLAIPEAAGEWQAYGAWRAGVIFRDALHDDERAAKSLQECSKTYVDSDWGYACLVDLGDLRRETHQLRPAIDAYRRALDVRPAGSFSEHCLYHSGLSYLSLGEPEQARVEWKELMDRYPKSVFAASVALERARSLDLQGDHKGALVEFRAVRKDWPSHSVAPLAAFGEAEALEQLGRLEEAEAAFEVLLAVHPNPSAVLLRIQRIKLRALRRERPNSNQPDSRRPK